MTFRVPFFLIGRTCRRIVPVAGILYKSLLSFEFQKPVLYDGILSVYLVGFDEVSEPYLVIRYDLHISGDSELLADDFTLGRGRLKYILKTFQKNYGKSSEA